MRNRDLRESTTTTSVATTNYDLPQWNGEDVTSWMTNLNDAFNKIDSAMWANHTAMTGYDKIASDLQKLADGIKVDNAEIREALRIVQQGMADQLTQLNQAKTDITNANLAISQLQTEDNALSAMIEDLQDDVGMLASLHTRYVHNYDPRVNIDDNWEMTWSSLGSGILQIGLVSKSIQTIGPGIVRLRVPYSEIARIDTLNNYLKIMGINSANECDHIGLSLNKIRDGHILYYGYMAYQRDSEEFECEIVSDSGLNFNVGAGIQFACMIAKKEANV